MLAVGREVQTVCWGDGRVVVDRLDMLVVLVTVDVWLVVCECASVLCECVSRSVVVRGA
jgi:hypothetical protein